MLLEKILNARPIGFQIAVGPGVHAVNSQQSEIPHPTNGRASGRKRIARAGRFCGIQDQIGPTLCAEMLFEDRGQGPGLPKGRGLVDNDPAGLLAAGGRRKQLANDFFRRHRNKQKVFEHGYRQRRHIGQGLPVGGRSTETF